MAKEPTTIEHRGDLEDRGSILDAFAGADKNGNDDRHMPMQTTHQTGMRVVGAQRIAVKRDERQVLEKIKFIAAAAGDDFYYRFPVKNRKENRVDYIEGPSIKAAMAVLRYYGNASAECYAVEDMGNEWIFHSRFIDYETGAELERPFRQRKSAGTIGGADRERALDIAFQIGVSKAVRNVIDGLLETFTEFAMNEAKNSLVEKIGKRLPEWRQRIALRLEENKFDPKRVEAVIGRTLDKWLAEDVARVLAMTKTIADGFSSWDEMFPPLVEEKSEDKPVVTTEGEAGEFAAGTTAEQKAGVKAAEATGEKVDPKTGELLKASIAAEDAKPAAAEGGAKPAEGAAKAAEPAAAAKAPATDDPIAGGPATPRGHTAAQAAAVKDTPPAEGEPDYDDLRRLGALAKKDGKGRSALPKELRAPGREREANAWLDGFAGREREPGEEG